MPAKIKYPIVDGKKECGSCGEWKPIGEYKKAGKHHVSRCRDCLKIYAAQYRQRPESKNMMAEYAKKYMANPENKKRANARQRRYNKTEKYKTQKNKNRREWSLIQKRKAVDYKGGKCIICGYLKCLAALDFHHKNPLEKDGYGTGALKAHWSWEKNKIELDKCVLVCVRCHREIHSGEITL